MPRYDYRCTACDSVFEIEHGMREHPDVACPGCGAPATRMLSASGIVFKGSGFYNTDQRGKKGSTEATGGTVERPSSDTEAPAAVEKSPSATPAQASTAPSAAADSATA